MKRPTIKMLLLIAMIIIPACDKNSAKAEETQEYVGAGEFVAYNNEEDYYYFNVYETGNRPAAKESVYYEDMACIPISIDKDLFESNFSFETMYTITYTDINKDGIYEISDENGLYTYIRWDNMEEEPLAQVIGYFEGEPADLTGFHPEIFKNVTVYKFKVLEAAKGEYGSDFAYVAYEKSYFEENLSYDNGYKMFIFDSGEKYNGQTLYTMYNIVDLRNMDYAFFDVLDKQELIENEKENQTSKMITDFKPMIIVAGVIVVVGVTSVIVTQKKRKNKKMSDEKSN